MPPPQSTVHQSGFGGGRHECSRMSQRTPWRFEITQPMFPEGDWKNVYAAAGDTVASKSPSATSVAARTPPIYSGRRARCGSGAEAEPPYLIES